MAKIPVTSVIPASVEKGYVAITAATRETEKSGKIDPANKSRTIVIPELDVSVLPSKFITFTVSALYATARDQLDAAWKTNGNSWAETDSELYTVDGLLAYAAREAESKRLSTATITAATSEFVATLAEGGRKLAAEILNSMAAPAKKGTEKQLLSLHQKLDAYMRENDREMDVILRPVLSKLYDQYSVLKTQREAYETDSASF